MGRAWVCVSAAVSAHVVVAAFLPRVFALTTPPPELVVDLSEPPAPREVAATADGAPAARLARVVKKAPAARQEPAPAPASSVVAATSATVTVPVGTAPTYSGGFTSPQGTGTGLGEGDGWLTLPPNLSAPARLGGRVAWHCPWPKEAEGDHAIAHLAVEADPLGRPLRVRIVDDPGHGFGTDAARCAMAWTYQPALDRDGRTARGWTRPFAVQFDRYTL